MQNGKTITLYATFGFGLALIWALAACATPATLAPTATLAPPTPTVEVARPSKEGGPGPALALTGDATKGQQIFVDNCKKCHGDEGKGGVDNPGSTDGTVPPLNPIDETLVDKDPKVFAYN